MKRLLLITLVAVLLTACSDAQGARKALEVQGFKDIQITGYRFFGCGQDDTFKTGFRAVGQNGAIVTGAVCQGWLKGATVRLD
jgi:hypothetical protein